MFKIIQDPINGPIKIESNFLSIIDSPEFQRLRGIKQLGLCYLVFPGANHTRFEHSLGTMKLAEEYGEALKADRINDLKAAALLHDIGHGPFSHSFEGLFGSARNLSHEEIGIRLILGKKPFDHSSLPGRLEESGFDPKGIAALISNEHESIEGSIISGQLDADEMDYLRRDSYYTGLGTIPFDYRRIINISGTDGIRIFIEEKGIPTIESILLNRFLMYKMVYFHKTSRIAQLMLSRAVELFEKDRAELLHMDDGDFLWNLKNDRGSREWALKVLKRDLFVPSLAIDYREGIEDIIKERLLENGFASDDFFIDVIPPKSFAGKKRIKTGVMVKTTSGMREAEEFSPLLSALSESFALRKVTIFTHRKNREKISELLDR
ncbi:MAG: HD domain-containing protein [Thermoplasmataceae archaeon]